MIMRKIFEIFSCDYDYDYNHMIMIIFMIIIIVNGKKVAKNKILPFFKICHISKTVGFRALTLLCKNVQKGRFM